jgi:hypothetical protein
MGPSGFTSHPKERCAADFYRPQNPSPRPGSNPQPLGLVASTLTTTPPRRVTTCGNDASGCIHISKNKIKRIWRKSIRISVLSISRAFRTRTVWTVVTYTRRHYSPRQYWDGKNSNTSHMGNVSLQLCNLHKYIPGVTTTLLARRKRLTQVTGAARARYL